MNASEDFGPGLRRERERRGISLQQIADQTKISAWFFAALERNDLSRWPSGIFRRAFVRAYAEVVGLDPDAVVCKFVQLFPGDAEAAPGPQRAGVPNLKRRLQATAIDLAGAVVVAAMAGLLLGRAAIWPALAIAATLIFVVGDLFRQSTIGAWLLSRRDAPRVQAQKPVAAAPPPLVVHEPRSIAHRRVASERHKTSRHHRARRPDRKRPRA